MIKRKGAFSNFKQGLERFLLIDSWYEYKNHALVNFAKDWCEANNIEVELEK